MNESEWIVVAVLGGEIVGGVLALAAVLLWDMWRNPKSQWSARARAEIQAAKAREQERRAGQ